MFFHGFNLYIYVLNCLYFFFFKKNKAKNLVQFFKYLSIDMFLACLLLPHHVILLSFDHLHCYLLII